MINRKNKYLTIFIIVGSMILSVGCSSQENNITNNQNTHQQSFKNNVEFIEDRNSIYGEIININEGNITLALGEFNIKNDIEESNEEKQSIDEHPNEIINLTGEEKIVNITNNIIISKINIKISNSENENKKIDIHTNEQLTLAELSLNDIIKVNYNEDNTKIKSVELIYLSSEEKNDEEINNELAKG